MKHNPFQGLRQQLGLPEAPTPPAQEIAAREQEGTTQPQEPVGAGPKRAVVRYERSGRGGKEVTVIEQLGLGQADLSAWLKAFKASLGCGGVIEGPSLVLQGDHRKRLPALLTARGVRRVTVG